MLFTEYTNEKQLGCDDEKKCMELYLEKQEGIKYVKKHNIPFAQGVSAARHFVQEAKNSENDSTRDIGKELDPTIEQDILECKEDEDFLHPDYIQVNPDDLELESNFNQIRKTLRNIESKTADEILNEARLLDKFPKMVLHTAIKFAQW